jgi:hypothetical protein
LGPTAAYPTTTIHLRLTSFIIITIIAIILITNLPPPVD